MPSAVDDIRLHKPEPRKRVKARKDRQEAALIAKVRADVWVRSEGECELCGRPMGAEDGELEHNPRRSQTRGMAMDLRHTMAGTCRAHRSCHQKTTANKWAVTFDSALLGFNGLYWVHETPRRHTIGGTILRQEARV